MIGVALPDANLALWVKTAGACLAVSGSTVSGYRVQRWLASYVPGFARLPSDLGPAIGLLAGIGWIVFS